MPPLTEHDLRKRAKSLGASEIAAVMGISEYASPHTIWARKVGLLPEFSGNEATEIGNALEPVIASMYCQRYGRTVTKGGYTVSATEPWMSATPDFHIVGGGLLECKVVGFRMIYRWGQGNNDAIDSDAVDVSYLMQAVWQLIVTGEPFNHVSALMGTELRQYTVRGNERLADAMVNKGRRFWHDHVLANVPPPVDGSDGATEMLKAMYPKAGAPAVRADVEIEDMVSMLVKARAGAKDADRAQTMIENQIKERIKDAGGAWGDGWRINWTETKAGTRPFKLVHDGEKKAKAA